MFILIIFLTVLQLVTWTNYDGTVTTLRFVIVMLSGDAGTDYMFNSVQIRNISVTLIEGP